MGFLDWLALATWLTTLVGMQVTPDTNLELDRTTSGQLAKNATAIAELHIGPQTTWRFSDSGTSTGLERAMQAKVNLRQVIQYKDLPAHYQWIGLRLGGDDALTTVNYFDMFITTVTQNDARVNHETSAKALGERWKSDFDREVKRLPHPIADGWIYAEGKPTPSLLVSDPTLQQTVADSLPGTEGSRITVKADGGTVFLEGQVNDDKERGRLIELVKEVPGVEDVVDHTSTLR